MKSQNYRWEANTFYKYKYFGLKLNFTLKTNYTIIKLLYVLPNYQFLLRFLFFKFPSFFFLKWKVRIFDEKQKPFTNIFLPEIKFDNRRQLHNNKINFHRYQSKLLVKRMFSCTFVLFTQSELILTLKMIRQNCYILLLAFYFYSA